MRILVVDDEKKIANALKKGLEQEAFAVDVAYDGEAGLSEVQNESYDLIVLDRMMPVMSGSEVLKQMRNDGNHTPVLFLTAKDKLSDKVEALNAGADDYLVKPFAFDELLARVRALLRRPTKAISTELVYKDLRLKSENLSVFRKEKKIELSKKEFALLEYMMRNAGATLSKDMIMQHVWDFDADILPNTVEVFIANLRNKIEKPFRGKKYIQTVRSLGYRFGEKK